MKEFIDKLIERLEEEKSEAVASNVIWAYSKVIRIVNQLAEEFAPDINVGTNVSEMPTGWIPCSERLPSREEYQKCNGQFIVSDGNRTYANYFDIYDTLKFGEPTMDKFKVDKCVIAWMPLPAPYTEGE